MYRKQVAFSIFFSLFPPLSLSLSLCLSGLSLCLSGLSLYMCVAATAFVGPMGWLMWPGYSNSFSLLLPNVLPEPCVYVYIYMYIQRGRKQQHRGKLLFPTPLLFPIPTPSKQPEKLVPPSILAPRGRSGFKAISLRFLPQMHPFRRGGGAGERGEGKEGGEEGGEEGIMGFWFSENAPMCDFKTGKRITKRTFFGLQCCSYIASRHIFLL